MDDDKRKKLEMDGWKVGNVGRFLNLSKEEESSIEEKLAVHTVPIDTELPDGHICETGQFKPYIQLVCSICSSKNRETPKDVYFAHNLPTLKGEPILNKEDLLLGEEISCEQTTIGKLADLEQTLHETKAELQEDQDRICFLEAEYATIVRTLQHVTTLVEKLMK